MLKKLLAYKGPDWTIVRDPMDLSPYHGPQTKNFGLVRYQDGCHGMG